MKIAPLFILCLSVVCAAPLLRAQEKEAVYAAGFEEESAWAERLDGERPASMRAAGFVKGKSGSIMLEKTQETFFCNRSMRKVRPSVARSGHAADPVRYPHGTGVDG